MKKDSKKETAKSKREAKKVASLLSLEGLAERDAKSLVHRNGPGGSQQRVLCTHSGAGDPSRGYGGDHDERNSERVQESAAPTCSVDALALH